MSIAVSILLALVAFFVIAYPFFSKPETPRQRKKSARDAGFCPKCGARRRKGDTFCPRCGASLDETAENDE